MLGPSPVVRARLNPELHKRFKALRKAEGLTESELLQRAVANELDRPGGLANSCAPGAATHAARVPKAIGEGVEKTRLTVRLPAYVRHAAAERARTQGFRVSAWISSLVQSHVASTPVLTETELLAVELTNRELGAIGRNINQIARALNGAHFQTERVRLDRLAELSEKVDATREAIRSLVRASRNAWGVE
jgi:hypothetical protein